MPKVKCGNFTTTIRNFELSSGLTAPKLYIRYYYEEGDQGCISGPYDRAVEPVSDYFEIQSITSPEGEELNFPLEDEEKLICLLQCSA